MKKRLLPLVLLSIVTAHAQQKGYFIQSVDFTKVKLTNNLWALRMEINRTAIISTSFERCESTCRVKNVEMAAIRSGKFCTTFPFDNTDIYNTPEGASYPLSNHPDAKLAAYLDTPILKISSLLFHHSYL